MNIDDKAALYAAGLIERGCTPEDAREAGESLKRELTAILVERVCPKCGAPIRSTIESNQHGPVELPPGGVWVSYRCSTQPPIGTLRPDGCCDYMMDLYEEPQ